MTMKTLEDFELMTVPVLKGIITELTGNAPKNDAKKAELVQLAYDLQQPVPQETQPEPAAEDEAPVDEQSAADLSVEDEDDLVGDAPAPTPEPVRPAKVEVPVSTSDAKIKDIEKALAHVDATIEVGNECVIVRKGAKRMTTTVKQPLHRIVKAVELFAR